jgi:hypothetical protein
MTDGTYNIRVIPLSEIFNAWIPVSLVDIELLPAGLAVNAGGVHGECR